jgi:hypothetical protein
MTLAMESEWIMKPWELMNDFQKLVFSDARICLMVWQNRNDEALQKDVELLQKQIRLAGDDPSRHLLVGYDLCEKRFAVERSSVSP